MRAASMPFLMTFSLCAACLQPCEVMIDSFKGSMVTIKRMCKDGHIGSRSSQPKMRNLPRGNLDLAGAILFSGSPVLPTVPTQHYIGRFSKREMGL